MSKYIAVMYDHLSCPEDHTTILGVYDTRQEAQDKINEHYKNHDKDVDIYRWNIEKFK